MKASVAVTTAVFFALPAAVILTACTSEFCAAGSHECPNGSPSPSLDGGPDGAGGSSGGTGGGGSGTGGATATGGGGSSGAGASVGTDGGGGDSGTGGSGLTGGAGGDAGGDGPINCDATGSPATAECLIDDAFAVFVAPGGNGDGTKEAPAGDLRAALDAAEARGLVHVIVCNGTYDARWELTGGDSGVRIHGGFTCPGETAPWTATPGTVPTVAPTAIGEALSLDGVSDVLIEDMAFTAPSETSAAGSSVGALVTNSTSVVLRRVAITAGDGLDGTDGVLVPFTGFPEALTLKGNDASGDSGGDLKQGDTCGVCPGGGFTLGGSGGDGGLVVSDGAKGFPDLGGGAAGTVSACLNSNTGGGNGASGASPAHAPSPASAGELIGAAWQTSSGETGGAGARGQGGGGGAGSAAGGGGGGGGCGACGGAGGPGGTGGGASIGIVVVQSTLTLEGGSITTGAGGDGGDGAAGQAGQAAGGFGGVQAGGGCAGGRGGPGGNGSAGSGGSGGSVFGILHGGQAPAVSDTAITLGAPGAAGLGGAAGVNDGVAGLATDIALGN